MVALYLLAMGSSCDPTTCADACPRCMTGLPDQADRCHAERDACLSVCDGRQSRSPSVSGVGG